MNKTASLLLSIASSDFATHYQHASLNHADQQRVAQSPTLATRMDWRVSRALKQQIQQPIISLSHSKGMATILSSMQTIRAGVDIEYMKPRDFSAFTAWICHEQEHHFLQQHQFAPEYFYRLWCTKEALIKAMNLNFPADMNKVGYTFSDGIITGLHANGENNWHGISAIWCENMAIAAVWQGNVQLDWAFYGNSRPENLAQIKQV